jgi:hypothetical protein
MPAFEKRNKPVLSAFLLTFVLIAACARKADDRRFELEQVDTKWSQDQLDVTVHQKLVLSSEARMALRHGIPLTLQLELLIRQIGSRTPIKKGIYTYEIRYLPLIEDYQLTRSGAVDIRTFPRLRHLLAELSTVKQSFSTVDLPHGSYELLARTHLDQKKMPPSMRLPMLFSGQWRHDSNWTLWPVESDNSG